MAISCIGQHSQLRVYLKRLDPVGGIVLPLMAGELFAVLFSLPHYLTPRPSRIAQSFADQRPYLKVHTLITIQEILGGFILGLVFQSLRKISTKKLTTSGYQMILETILDAARKMGRGSS